MGFSLSSLKIQPHSPIFIAPSFRNLHPGQHVKRFNQVFRIGLFQESLPYLFRVYFLAVFAFLLRRGKTDKTYHLPASNVIQRMGDGYHELKFYDMNQNRFVTKDTITLFGIWDSKKKSFFMEEILKQ